MAILRRARNGLAIGVVVAVTCHTVENISRQTAFPKVTAVVTYREVITFGFWCDWNTGDGAVMMIGGGGSGCGRADHGIAITEEEHSAFKESSNQGECDFGNEVMNPNCTTSYSLNLWIK